MKSVEKLVNQALVESIRKLAADERKLGVEILRHLQEIARRNLHLAMGHSSLFTFCVVELKYSEATAYQKVQALKLLEAVPEVGEKLETGTLSFSNAARIQSFARAAKRRGVKVPSRRELVKELENKSKREAELLLASLSPEPFRVDQIKPIDATHSEVRFVAGERLLKKLEKIKELRSHVNPNPSMSELLEDMADLLLARIDPERDRKTRVCRAASSPGEVGSSSTRVVLKRKYIPAALRRKVWKRDGARCTYVEPGSDRRCGSRHLLQVDHQVPQALGGPNTAENLRLYCSAHNQLAAVRSFGSKFMETYSRNSGLEKEGV